MPENVQQAETEREFSSTVERWCAELDTYTNAFEDWKKDAERIVRRYALEGERRSNDDSDYSAPTLFNILWSNVQTIQPSLFAAAPVPVVQRRHKDPDPIGRLAAEILERALITEMEDDDWLGVFDKVTLDVLLAARGQPWIRYEADVRKVKVRLEVEAEGGEAEQEIEEERLVSEKAPLDYVHWGDFAHSPKKTWEEVVKQGWVAKRVRMTRRQGEARFGEAFKKVPLQFKPEGMDDAKAERLKGVMGTAEVWELWDAVSRKVYWFVKEYTDSILDERDDPLSLDGFFPCPKPAYGSLTNENLVPVPDYLQYEPQADELDDVTNQISELIPAVRVAGAYDSRAEDIGKLFTDGSGRNELVPVDGLMDFAGGRDLAGVIRFLPVDEVAGALASLYDVRDRTSQTIYEISGVSDIIRGQVDPREKLGQSRLKGRFASQRLHKRQAAVEHAARDALRIKAEIMAEKYADKTLRELSGFDFLPEVIELREKAEAKEGAGAGEMATESAWEQARALLRDEKMRGFRVEIETDSTIALDAQEEQESRVEFLGAAGGFLQQALPVIEAFPPMAPLLGDMLLFGVRAFKAGRPLEAAFEEAIDRMKERLEQSQGQPDPAQQAAAQAAQADAEASVVKSQADAQKAQAQAQAATQQAQMTMAQGEQQMAHEERRAQLKLVGEQASTDAKVAQSEAKTQEMLLRLEATISELTARVEAAEQMANIKTRGALEAVATRKDGGNDGA